MTIELSEAESPLLNESYLITYSNYVQMSHSGKPTFLNNRVSYANEFQTRIAVTTRELMYKFIEAQTYYGGPCAGLAGKRLSKKKVSSQNSSMIIETPMENTEGIHERSKSPRPRRNVSEERRVELEEMSEIRQLQLESSRMSLNPLMFFNPNECADEDRSIRPVYYNQHTDDSQTGIQLPMHSLPQNTQFEIETETVDGQDGKADKAFTGNPSFIEETAHQNSENKTDRIIVESQELTEIESDGDFQSDSHGIRYFSSDAFFCDNCNEYGHLTRRCMAPLKNACRFCLGSHQGRWCPPVCFICKTMGHLQNECKYAHMHKRGLCCPSCKRIGHVNDCRTLTNRFANQLSDEQNMKEVKCMSCSGYGHFNCDTVV